MLIGEEFGRTPAVEVSGLVKVQNGRDHNSHGFSMLLTAPPMISASKLTYRHSGRDFRLTDVAWRGIHQILA